MPNEISVAGIGGTATGRVCDLTTMALPLAQLGGLAADYITGAAAMCPPVPAYRLRAGGTTAAPPAAVR